MFLSRKFLLGIALVAVVVTSGHVIAAKPESEKLKIFSQVLSYVRNNYVEEVDEDIAGYGINNNRKSSNNKNNNQHSDI